MQAGRQKERKKKKKGLGMRGISKLLHEEQLGREKSATEKRNGAHIMLLMYRTKKRKWKSILFLFSFCVPAHCSLSLSSFHDRQICICLN
jgi:hypothetical protein